MKTMNKASELFEGNNSSLRRAYDEATCKGYTAGCLCEKCLKTDDESIKEEPAYIGGVDLTPNTTKDKVIQSLAMLVTHSEQGEYAINEKIVREEIEKLLAEQKVDELNISYLRQWLNEDRITDPDKMITNEDIKHFLNLKTNDKPKSN